MEARRRRAAIAGASIMLAVAVALALFHSAAFTFISTNVSSVGSRLISSPAPADDSPEAGFARDMQVHHAQAVEMALIIREKSTDPILRSLAYDIATGQQQQAGQMYGWLESWDLPQMGRNKAMSWMSEMDHSSMSSGSSMSLLPDGRMPGMASAQDMQALRDLRGQAAEILFLQLMVTHHESGVMMAEAILQKTEQPQVRDLARAIKTAQTTEIRALKQLLDARGATTR